MSLPPLPPRSKLLAAADARVSVTSTSSASYTRVCACRFTVIRNHPVIARAFAPQAKNDTAGSGIGVRILDFTSAANVDANAKTLAYLPWVSVTAGADGPVAISTPAMLLPPGDYLYILGIARITSGTATLTAATGSPIRLEVCEA